MKKIRVLIVDDSTSYCALLTKILSSDPEIEVIGSANDAYKARDMIKLFNPDVLTLDVEMPGMNGLTFLSNLMRLRPMPVVMISSLTNDDAEVTMEALSRGAVDFLVKRDINDKKKYGYFSRAIITRVKTANKVNINNIGSSLKDHSPVKLEGKVLDKVRNGGRIKLIVIGSSTGGPEALRMLLSGKNFGDCAVLIAQHIPDAFCQSLTNRLNSVSPMKVSVAKNNEKIESGHIYVAPGDQHLRITRTEHNYYCNLGEDDRINGHRPAVEPLFDSVASIAPTASVGVMLTGMGKDGSEALKRLKDANAITIAQDETSSVVWGMPGYAVKIGGADIVLPLDKIANTLIEIVKHNEKEKAA